MNEPLRRQIRRFLERKGISQNQMARDLGISHAHLSQIVAGVRRPSLNLAVRIETMTGIDARSFAEAS